MKIEDAKIKDILLEKKYVSKDDLENAESYAKKYKSSIVDYLIFQNILTKDLLGQAIAETYNIPYTDLNSNPPSKKDVLRIPQKIAKDHRVVYVEEKEKEVILATDSPIRAIKYFKEVEDLFPNKKTKLTYSLTEDIEASFIHYRKKLEARLEEIIKSKERVAPQIIDEIIDDAIVDKASDIHIEPQEREVILRFRIDGVLYEIGVLGKELYENVLNRIKVMARLRVDDHFSAQDGAIRYQLKDMVVDLRVSIAPTLDGEKVTIRVLSKYIRGLALTDLGLSPKDQELITEASHKPFGMILVTGPTGSGKTTTLYALLKTLHKKEVNITTIEDPVEYRIPGINQIQVNPQTNLTFAKGLKSIVRQDPDIILVGEIRDTETAEIGVNAALTGHLLLSTFHANDASTAIPRLLDMGVEPFLLASTLQLVVAQRLVRRICEQCRYSYTVKRDELLEKYPVLANYFSEKEITLYKGKGCSTCSQRGYKQEEVGYKGRVAIFEIINSTPELKELILTNPSSRQIWELAKSQGARSLFDDGIGKVRSGLTTIDELLRVAMPPEIVNLVKTKKNGTKKETAKKKKA